MSKFITIHKFYNPVEAEIFKAKLESLNISSHLIDQNVAYSIGPTIMDGFRLQVRENDYEKAQEILEKYLENR